MNRSEMLKSIMRSGGATQSEIAKYLETSQSEVSRMLNGKAGIKLTQLAALNTLYEGLLESSEIMVLGVDK